MFYNTTNETNPDLSEYRNKALNQDERVLGCFKRGNKTSWTPSEILFAAFDKAPITSVRRSMTNLTDKGKLEKTTHQRMGSYGRPEYVWILASKTKEQMELW